MFCILYYFIGLSQKISFTILACINRRWRHLYQHLLYYTSLIYQISFSMLLILFRQQQYNVSVSYSNIYFYPSDINVIVQTCRHPSTATSTRSFILWWNSTNKNQEDWIYVNKSVDNESNQFFDVSFNHDAVVNVLTVKKVFRNILEREVKEIQYFVRS